MIDDGKAKEAASTEAIARRYEKPVLIEFGTVRELTLGTGKTFSEALPPGSRRGA